MKGQIMSKRPKELFKIPERNMRYIELDIHPDYVLYQNGDLYSRVTGKYITKTINDKGIQMYSFRNIFTNKNTTITIKSAIRKYFFNQLPQIPGVKHQTIVNFPDYELYSNGKVWSKNSCFFLQGVYAGGTYYVSLVNEFGTVTFYPHKHIRQYFGDEQ